MSGMQAKTRKFNVHQLAAKESSRPTLFDMILNVLTESSASMDYLEVDAAVRRSFPAVTIGQGSVQAVLSSLYRNGTLTGSRRSGEMRTRYSLSPLAPVLSHVKVKESQPIHASKVADIQIDTNGFSVAMSPLLFEAISALLQHRYGSAPSRKIMSSFVRGVLSQFLDAAPYEKTPFFWVKSRPSNGVSAKLTVALNGADAAIYDRITTLAKNTKLLVNGVAMDGARQSTGTRLTMTLVGHTAVVWYLATSITDEERAVPAVAKFLDYAALNFRLGDRKAVEAYQSTGLDKASTCADAAPVSAGSDAGETPQAQDCGLTIESDEAGGLCISIRFSPEIMEQMVSLVMGVVNHSS